MSRLSERADQLGAVIVRVRQAYCPRYEVKDVDSSRVNRAETALSQNAAQCDDERWQRLLDEYEAAWIEALDQLKEEDNDV